MLDSSLYKEMLEIMYEGIYFVDSERKISFWNKGAEGITGFSAKEVVGSHCFNNILNHVDDDGNPLCTGGCPLHATIFDGEKREGKVYLHHKDGHRVAVAVKTIPIFEEGKIIGAVEIFVDDREKIQMLDDMKQLKELTIRDQLTNLPNRRYIEEYVNSKLNDYDKFGIPFGVAFIDIDHFKNVNDTYGHDIGDDVLKMVSETYISGVRKNDIVGRWGGEEFIAVFTGASKEDLEKTTEKIRMLIEHSKLRVDATEISITVSIGATTYNGNESVEDMIKRADEQMYLAKKTGRNKVIII